jgi:uncharacterized protein YciI
MFLILLTFKKPMSEVDRFVGEHREFLERYYASGHFLLSGRKEPPAGGVILAKAETQLEIQSIIANDPFYIEQIAQYHIIQFSPSMSAPNLAELKTL